MKRIKTPEEAIRKIKVDTSCLQKVYIPQQDKILSIRSKHYAVLYDADAGEIATCDSVDKTGRWDESFRRSVKVELAKNFFRVDKTEPWRTTIMTLPIDENGMLYGLKLKYYNQMVTTDCVITFDKKTCLFWFSDDQYFPYGCVCAVRLNTNSKNVHIG